MCRVQGLGFAIYGSGCIEDYNSTPSIKPYIVLISSLNPGGVLLGGGTVVIPYCRRETPGSFEG